jgi:hypothetical protein
VLIVELSVDIAGVVLFDLRKVVFDAPVAIV